MPSGWSGDWVRMLRMTASLSIASAIFGRYSQIWMPGTLVAFGRNSPPVGRPGFMSKVSIWLAPPFIHRRMQRLPAFFAVSAAERACTRPPQLGTTRPPVVASAPLRNARRVVCWSMGSLFRVKLPISKVQLPSNSQVPTSKPDRSRIGLAIFGPALSSLRVEGSLEVGSWKLEVPTGSMVKPELRRVEQGPDGLLGQRFRLDVR